MPLGSNCNPVTDESIKNLLDWCDTNDISIDPRIEILRNGDGSLSVYTRDAFIEAAETRTFSTLLLVVPNT